MLNMVKDLMHSFEGGSDVAKRGGHRNADLAKRIASDSAKLARQVGYDSAVLARRFGDETADVAKRVGSTTADIAKRVGSNTAELARRVGPKRGLIGLVLLAAAVGGGVYLVRYLRARSAELDESETTGEEGTETQGRRRKGSRAQRKNNPTSVTH